MESGTFLRVLFVLYCIEVGVMLSLVGLDLVVSVLAVVATTQVDVADSSEVGSGAPKARATA